MSNIQGDHGVKTFNFDDCCDNIVHRDIFTYENLIPARPYIHTGFSFFISLFKLSTNNKAAFTLQTSYLLSYITKC